MFSGEDKRCELADLVARICDGDTVAVGGGLSWREPMAAVRELVMRSSNSASSVASVG